MKQPTLTELYIESVAIALYHDAIRTTPQVSTMVGTTEVVADAPRWVELGTELRQTYRGAVLTLIAEQRK